MATKMVASTKIQNNFGAILDDVIQNRTRYVIKRRGVPQAIMLSLSDLEKILDDKSQQRKIGKVVSELSPTYDLGETISED